MSNGMIKASVMMVIIYALAFWAFGTDINEVQETIIVVFLYISSIAYLITSVLNLIAYLIDQIE